MTENEVKKILYTMRLAAGLDDFEKPGGVPVPLTKEDLADACKMAIKALEEVQQYRAIGTPEECREAVEKQKAKKVKSISQVKDGDSYVGLIGRCPCCGDILEEDTVYCDCGQRLDWSDEDGKID